MSLICNILLHNSKGIKNNSKIAAKIEQFLSIDLSLSQLAKN